MVSIAPYRRVRRTPFSPRVEAAGVQGYTVYNHMLLATSYESLEADYYHLKRHVQVWDVSCERQISVRGPDAYRLIQLLTPRDIARIDATRCLYVPLCDQFGGMVNDPVLLNPAQDEYWLSIASSDVLLWITAIVGMGDFDVTVTESDVYPMAIQGPKADALAARLFGDAVTDLGFFRCARFDWNGHNMLVARSGWSKQGGFEVYVEGEDLCLPLWDAAFDLGEDLDVSPGCPNLIERIEGGLLSYGSDMTRDDSPLQAGLGRYVADDQLATCWGGRAIAKERAAGTTRQIRALEIEGRPKRLLGIWPLLVGGERVGMVTSAAWSPDFGCTVAVAMIDRAHWDAGTEVEVKVDNKRYPARVRDRFWI